LTPTAAAAAANEQRNIMCLEVEKVRVNGISRYIDSDTTRTTTTTTIKGEKKYTNKQQQ
jgi:hypothetical protein